MKTNLLSITNRIPLVLLFLLLSILSWGQLTLGTSPYTQNFNGTTLPTGWSTRTSASATALGTSNTPATTDTWANTASGFKFCASVKSPLTSTSNAATQNSASDRSLSVRSSGSLGDPGQSFALQIANTTGKTGFSLTFNAQLQDVQGRTTTYRVDYGTGSTPTSFTQIGTTFTDLGINTGAWGTQNLTFNFGTSLDNISSNVWIRIVSLSPSTGSGSRCTFGIDDVSLSWSTASASYSGVSAGAGVKPATLSSLINTQAASVLNFDFTVTDDSNTASFNDNLPTLINQIVIPQGSGNDISDWTQAIAGAVLTDGTNTITGTVNAGNITFSGIPVTTSALGYIADDGNKTYVLKIWLNTTLGGTLPTTVDGLNLAFKVDRSNFTTASSATSTQFESGAGTAVESGANNNAVSVIATKIAFVQQPSNATVNSNMSPAVTVSANDANGNRDLDYVTSMTITSTGSLSGSPVNTNAILGLASYSSLQHTATGSGLKLTVNSSSFAPVDSNIFNVTLVSAATDYFRSKVTTGNWANAGSWESSSNGITWIDATLAPTSSATAINILNGNTITVAASATGKNITVETGGILAVNSSFTITGTNAVNGTWNQTSSTAISNSGTLVFNANSIYNHNVNGGTIPTATWNLSSNCNIIGYTNSSAVTGPSGIGQTFGNLTFNNASSSSYINLFSATSSITVNGTLTVGPASGNLVSFSNSSGTITANVNKINITGGALNGVGASAVLNLSVATDLNISGDGVFRMSTGTGVSNVTINNDVNLTDAGVIQMVGGTASTVPAQTMNVMRDFIINGVSAQLNMKSNSSSSAVPVVNVGRNFSSNNTDTSAVDVDFGTGTVTNSAINITGNLTHTGNGVYQTNSSSQAKGFVFKGTSSNPSQLSYSGENSNYTSYVVDTNAYAKLLTDLTLGGSTGPVSYFTVNGSLDFSDKSVAGNNTARFITTSGATLVTSNTNGIGGTTSSGSLKSFASTNTSSSNGTAQLVAGVNYTFNANTIAPFPTGTFGNPAIVNINANVTNNISGVTTTVTNALNIANGALFGLNTAANSNLSLSNTGAKLNIASGGTFDNCGENYITSSGGTPSVVIDGTFITRDAQGFTGTNTSIPSIVPALGTNSIIEYGLNGNQAVTDFAYKNLTFSGGGTKTTTTISSITGTVTINSGVIVDADTKTFGGSGTNLTMLGTGKLITGGSGTKPDAQGSFSLANTSTIEFTGTSATQIRLAPQYANVIVAGTNVVAGTTTNGGLTFQNGGRFTVKNGARFKVNNDNGFSGATTTAIKNTNTPVIILEAGSTIDYTGSDQIITNNLAYENLTISTAGTKTGASGNLMVNNLTTVSAGILKISETVDNATSNVLFARKGISNSGGTVSFASNSQLMQDNDAINTGNIKSSRNAKLPKMGYTYWSSPVALQNLYTFSNGGLAGGTPKNRFFVYDEATDTFKNTGVFLLNDTSVFETGKGYAVRGMDNFSMGMPTTSYEFIFTGVPNNASVSFTPLKWTNASKGYNLVGNPYPSNINFDDLYNANSTRMYATAYFWTNNDMTVTQQQGSGYSGNNYAIYNLTGGTPSVHIDGAPDQPSLASITPSNIIKVAQGFIIKTKQAGKEQSLNFTNDIRITDNGTFFNNKSNSEKDRFWLQLTSPSNIANVILVGYIPGATNDFEIDFDGELFIIGSDSFYSLLDSKKLAIQGKASFSQEDKVSLGNVYSQNGNYKISIADKQGIFSTGQNIYLKDKLLNKVINLSNEDYIFQAVKGTDVTRFDIIYKDEVVLNTGSDSKSDFIVYRDGDNQVIKSSKKLGNIEIFDVSGKLIKTYHTPSNEIRLDTTSFLNGVYILKVENSGDIKTKKIIK